MIDDPSTYSYDDTKAAISALPLELKMITALAYATGSRVSELIQIRARDVTFDEKYMRISCKVMKKIRKQDDVPTKRKKARIRRTAVVRLDETWLVDPIKELLKDKKKNAILIPLDRRVVWKKISTGVVINGEFFYPHAFRTLRATHLATKFKFTGQQLKHFFEWSSSAMADQYVKMNTKDIEY